FDTVFHHQMKHLEVRQKYSAARRIFNSLLGVSSGDETLHLMFDILRIKLDGLETFSVCYVHQDVCTVVIHLFVLNRKVLKLSAFVMFIKTCVQKKIKGLLKMGTIQFFIPVSQDLTFS
ncbi:MAG: hypothetical protein MI923_20090, partial [Phycisphaerales bacterium]|nr:hypothetical protein [Phycisphaerales bacterium]